jgi:hypothetical protein
MGDPPHRWHSDASQCRIYRPRIGTPASRLWRQMPLHLFTAAGSGIAGSKDRGDTRKPNLPARSTRICRRQEKRWIQDSRSDHRGGPEIAKTGGVEMVQGRGREEDFIPVLLVWYFRASSRFPRVVFGMTHTDCRTRKES